MKVNLHPTICNLCGGKVVYINNSAIYGRSYGSGYCYLCKGCGGFVGTHRPRPREALGLLADARMRKGKRMCHDMFDAKWQGKPGATKKRNALYYWLANRLGIPPGECHFGWFDLETLQRAYKILKEIDNMQMVFDGRNISFTESPRRDAK